MMKEFRECPFCGKHELVTIGAEHYFTIKCKPCNLVICFKSREEALRKWNRRPQEGRQLVESGEAK